MEQTVIVNSKNEYKYCVIHQEETLTFESGDYRQGGTVCGPNWFKSYGKTYWEAVGNYLELIKKGDSFYYEEIEKKLKEIGIFEQVQNKIIKANEKPSEGIYFETYEDALNFAIKKLRNKAQLKTGMPIVTEEVIKYFKNLKHKNIKESDLKSADFLADGILIGYAIRCFEKDYE